MVAISEVDKYALQGYYSLHDKNILNLGDITNIKIEDIPQHDLFTYSFPCQDISVAGKTKGIINIPVFTISYSFFQFSSRKERRRPMAAAPKAYFLRKDLQSVH